MAERGRAREREELRVLSDESVGVVSDRLNDDQPELTDMFFEV